MSEVPNYDVFISLKVDFTLTNGVDPDEMPDFLRHFIWVFTVCRRTQL